MARILLVEDDAALASGVTRVLRAHSAGQWQLEHAQSAGAALALVAGGAFELAIIDLGLPDMSGAELIRQLGQAAPGLRAVAFTIFDDRERVLSALRAGAVGYLLKDDPIERITAQIQECLEGQFPISSRIARYLLELCRPLEPEHPLTPRERDVLTCLEQGATYAECAEQLGITLGTVQTHIKSLYRKLDVNSRSAAAAWAAQRRRPA